MPVASCTIDPTSIGRIGLAASRPSTMMNGPITAAIPTK
jgi:hypothetical protein